MLWRGVLAGLIVAFGIGGYAAYATGLYSVTTDARVRGEVLFIGDSNVSRAGAAIDDMLINRSDGYLPVMGSRDASSIRLTNCLYPKQACDSTATEYWKYRLANVLARVTPDAVVIDFGINDTHNLGTCTSIGYACYDQKIDWLMAKLPNVPVFWTNLPCSIEALDIRTACLTINAQLATAPKRWSNLTVLDWGKAAFLHTAYMGSAPHYSVAGYAAWATLVGRALDATFPP